MRVFPNGFGLILGLLTTFVVSWIWPLSNGSQEVLFSDWCSKFAVVLIFLIQGWNLKFDRLRTLGKSSFSLLRVHGLIFFGPLLIVLLFEYLGFLPEKWIAGFLFFGNSANDYFQLCCLHCNCGRQFRCRPWSCHPVKYSRNILGSDWLDSFVGRE